MEKYRKLDLLTLELGSDLCSEKQLDKILKSVHVIREEIFDQYGVVIPSVRVKNNYLLNPLEYAIRVNGFTAGSFVLKKNSILIMDAGNVKTEMKGIPTIEPAYGCPVLWISKSKKVEAEQNGYVSVIPEKVIYVHLTEKVKENLSSVITIQYVSELLDEVVKENNFLCTLLAKKYGTAFLPVVKMVLSSLLNENVSIRNLLPILDTIANEPKVEREKIQELVNKVRCAIVPEIINPLAEKNKIRGLVLSENLHKYMAEHMEGNGEIFLEPVMRRWFDNEASSKIADMTKQGFTPVVFTLAHCRYGIRKLFEEMCLPNVSVISDEEVVIASRKLNYTIDIFDTMGDGFVSPAENKETQQSTPQKIAKEDFEKLQNQINRIISRLDPFEQKVISMRFGLDGECSHTLDEVGQAFDLSLKEIRMIEAKALRLLRTDIE